MDKLSSSNVARRLSEFGRSISGVKNSMVVEYRGEGFTVMVVPDDANRRGIDELLDSRLKKASQNT
jgi:hypothetical protein